MLDDSSVGVDLVILEIELGKDAADFPNSMSTFVFDM